MRALLSAGFLCFALLLSAPVAAENWPQWRGPLGNGISTETGIATEWGQDRNVAWKLPLPGPGGATPVVWGDRIFVTSASDSDLVLLCVSTAGEKLWEKTVGTGNETARGDEGNSASPSPATDGKHVWVMFATGLIACYDVDGHEVWKFNLQERYGKFSIQFGMTSTPLLHDGSLFLQLIHGDMGGDYIVGKVIRLDAATGDELWSRDRESGAVAENRHSYASPIIFDDGERTTLVTHGADHTIAYNLENGEEVWRLGGLNGKTELNQTPFDRTLRFVASPAAADGVLIVPTAKGGPIVALRPRGVTGSIAPDSPAVLWVNEKTPDVPCPLIVDGIAYLCLNDGRVFAVDIESGEELYHERTHNHQHRASPIFVDGRLYNTARDGRTTVMQTGREFAVLAENDLGEAITASPVVSDGTLYLRTYQHLYAIRGQ
jgi:outer membrane protein assembly factor BamB